MNADSSGGGHAARGAVLGGTAGDGWGRAAAYDAYADGLHTYALWHLHDHDAAADAVYCAFVAADRNHTNLQQAEQIQPWLYALLRRECRLRATESGAPAPASGRLRPKPDALGESGVADSLMQLEGNLRRAEFHSLAWPEAEGLSPAHREVLELTIRHGLDSRGLALVLGLREGVAGLAPSRGFGLLADAWRELERSLAAAAVAASGRENCAQLAELTFGWSGKLNATLRAPLTNHVDGCSRCQHYLHTVIGTPSAPTMLPFVAAPRALREILLAELADAALAQRSGGVDVVALGARCGAFGPDGFPARIDPAQGVPQASAASAAVAGAGAGRAPRRRMTASRAGRAGRPPVPAPRPTPPSEAPTHAESARPVPPVATSSTVGFSATTAGTAVIGAAGEDGSTSSIGFTATATGSAYVHATPRPSGGATVGFTATAAGTAIVDAESFDAAKASSAAAPQDSNLTRSAGLAAVADAAPSVPPPMPAIRRRSDPPPRSTTQASDSPSDPSWRTFPEAATASGRPRPRMPEVDEIFRADGSWAERVLPPQQPGPASAALAAAAVDMDDLWRPEPETTFVETASGRFATRAPARPGLAARRPGSAGEALTAVDVDPPAGADAVPGVPRPGARPPRSPGADKPAARPAPAGVRPRHKARPMRQAVVSAVALGAIGAVAAAAAAMLGATSDSHSNTTALDGSQSGTPLGRATSAGGRSGNLSVSVTTGGAASTLGGTGTGPGTGTSAAALSGVLGATSATPVTASSGAFYVSVNQRAADPDSVQILVRNAGTAPLDWSAAPTVSWLALSQSSGTLAPGASTTVTATAGASAPSGLWAARILFSPGGIVVTVHGGIPSSAGGGAGSPTSPASGSTPSGPGPSPTPTQSSQPPTSGASPSDSASAGASGGGSQDPTTSGPAGGPTGSGGGSGPGTPRPRPSVVGSPARPAPRGHGR